MEIAKLIKIKKMILILVALLWAINPCLASTSKPASSTHKTAHKHVTHKKKKAHKAKKKSHAKKSAHKKSHPKESPISTATTETESSELTTEKITELANLNQATPPTSFVTSIEQRLVNFVQKSISNLHYSSYKLGGTKIDSTQGIYIVDCSGYVDHTLRAVFPNAYLSLVNSSGTEKPNTSHYYNFFTSLNDDPDEFWSKVEDIEQLQPGDILVFRYKHARRNAGGHVMVVMNKPVQDGDSYLVSVADSAASGHSEDTRQAHVSGVGIGTLLLKVNPKTRQPSAYAWKVGSRWKRNVSFAMARPMEIETSL